MQQEELRCIYESRRHPQELQSGASVCQVNGRLRGCRVNEVGGVTAATMCLLCLITCVLAEILWSFVSVRIGTVMPKSGTSPYKLVASPEHRTYWLVNAD